MYKQPVKIGLPPTLRHFASDLALPFFPDMEAISVERSEQLGILLLGTRSIWIAICGKREDEGFRVCETTSPINLHSKFSTGVHLKLDIRRCQAATRISGSHEFGLRRYLATSLRL